VAWYKKERDMRKALFFLMVVFVAAGVYARGNQETGPEIGVGDDETVYISPDASPGVQDSVTIPITVSTDARRNDVVVAYTIEVTNASGQIVWTESAVDETERPGFFGRLMQNLGLRERETTVQIPESREWDGTYKNSPVGRDGTSVPDGEYSYIISVTDSGEETGTSDPRTVVVDNTLPTATVESEYSVFSPDGDGRKDTVSLSQSTSSEDEWVGSISRGGSEVFRLEWTGSVPQQFTWDGKNLAGRDLDDGDYVYALSSTDRAGNTFTFTLPAVTIDTAPRPLSLSVDNAAFSPNGDGIKDTVTLDFGRVDTTRLESAIITVSDSRGTELESVEVGALIGADIEFDGYLNAARTMIMPEGTYQVSVRAEYGNGAIREAGPVDVTVDVTPPSGSVSASADIFSPEGDGLKDTVAISHRVAGNDSWRGFVFVAGADVLETFDFGSEVPAAIVWDGNDLDGNPIPDGIYSYQLIGTDAAGNQAETNVLQVTVDRRPTTMDIAFSRRYFSPNGDGQGDTVIVRPNLSVPRGVATFSVTVMDGNGNVVGSGSGRGDLPSTIEWDGSDLRGTILPEGDYTAELSLVYEKGNRVTGMSPVLTIDNTIPTVALRASSDRITPNGDGIDDTIDFIPSVSPANEIVRSTGRILTLDGDVIAEIEGTRPVSVEWDGSTTRGIVAPDDVYVAELEVEHRNGTIRTAESGVIALGSAAGMERAVLRVNPSPFSPDGDGVNDTVRLTLAVLGGGPVASWELSVYDPDGRLFYSFPVGDDVIRSVEWDGRNARGELVEMAAEYEVRYEVTDATGNVETGSEPLIVDVLTEEMFGMRRILVDNVLFEGYTTRFLDWDEDIEAQNIRTLEKIGDILRLFPDYRLELHGHAVSVLYYDEAASDREQREVLLPLSEARTETILRVLTDRGANPSLFTTRAYGKSRPLVPFSDLDGRYVNRRVEFYLVR
jgi:flagellar hook assembly protein FlgD